MKRKRDKPKDAGPQVRVIDGAVMQLHMWLVLEKSAAGIPLKLMMTFPDESIEECLARAEGEYYRTEEGGPMFELMWTPQRYLSPRN